jgi:hypothetical protein
VLAAGVDAQAATVVAPSKANERVDHGRFMMAIEADVLKASPAAGVALRAARSSAILRGRTEGRKR